VAVPLVFQTSIYCTNAAMPSVLATANGAASVFIARQADDPRLKPGLSMVQVVITGTDAPTVTTTVSNAIISIVGVLGMTTVVPVNG